jgi:pimeloyl-ACP methyl ester carboxylesterase
MQTIALDNAFEDTTITNVDSRRAARAGRALSAVAVLFLLFDSTGKLLEVQPVVDGTIRLGYPQSVIFSLGLIQLLCVATYVIPRTSVLGAVLLTGYLGGAVATHVRVESPLFTHVLFPIYLASFLWAGLALRDSGLRQFFPWRLANARRIERATADSLETRGAAMKQAISRDGTAIAYERTGQGPALILVDGALCSRSFGPMPKLAPLLTPHFTVFTYDRRGRGQSGDTQPYSKEREVEDIAALIQEAGGSACVLGLSSGGALALEAAARAVGVTKVAAYEPPFVEEGGQNRGAEHEHQLKRLLADGKRGEAVKYFMRSMVGAPAALVIMMRLMPWIWRKLEAVAHTLPYDAAVMNGFKVPTARFASIMIPTLVMHGSKTDVRLQNAARAVAAAVPEAQHVTLAEQTHNVKPDVLAPAVVKFFAA